MNRWQRLFEGIKTEIMAFLFLSFFILFFVLLILSSYYRRQQSLYLCCYEFILADLCLCSMCSLLRIVKLSFFSFLNKTININFASWILHCYF